MSIKCTKVECEKRRVDNKIIGLARWLIILILVGIGLLFLDSRIVLVVGILVFGCFYRIHKNSVYKQALERLNPVTYKEVTNSQNILVSVCGFNILFRPKFEDMKGNKIVLDFDNKVYVKE